MYSARLPYEKLKIPKEFGILFSPQFVPEETSKLTSCMNHLVYEVTILTQLNFVEQFAFGASVHGCVAQFDFYALLSDF